MKSAPKMLTIILAIGVFGYAGAANAQSSPPTSDTLANLIATGGSLAIADKTFSGFNVFASSLTSFNPANILVTASQDANGVDYLTWGGNISVASAGVATADLLLNYIVTAHQGSISMIDQSYTGSAQGGLLSVDETVATGSFGGIVVAKSHLEVGDLSDPPAETTVIGDNLFVNPSQSILYVTKNIGLAVTSPNGGFITISQVSQSFHQVVPEPSSLGLLSGGLGLLAWMRHARRRKIAD